MTLDAGLLHEVAQIQRRKDLIDFRDIIEKIDVTENKLYGYGTENRTAAQFKDDLIYRLRKMEQ